MTVKWIHNSFTSLRKQLTLGDATTDFPAKWRLRNERRNSILMMRHYPDLGSTSDWSCRVGNLIQLIRSTSAKHQVTSGPGLKQITFRLKTRQALVNQTNGANNFGRISKNGKKVIPRKVLLSFWKNFHRDEPFHLNSPWNYRVFHTNGKRSLATPWQGKTTTLHVHRDFVYISLPSLHDYHGKMPNFTFCEGRKHAGNDKFFFLFMNLDVADRNSAPEEFACIWQSRRVGIITIETEKMWIHFSCDVFVAFSCRGILNSLIFTKAWSMQAWMPVVSSSFYFRKSVFSFRVDSIFKWRVYIKLKVSCLRAFL